MDLQSDYSEVSYRVENAIATITLNRPDKMNAFTPVMMGEMIKALDAADADDRVRAVVITGAGKAFCAGADLKPQDGGGPFTSDETVDDLSDHRVRDTGGRLTLRLFEMHKPVIAAINGAAVGIGATMTLAMDVRLASDDARFGFVFARRGIVPEAASSWFLPRLVGLQRALEWCMTGRIFGAGEAQDAGLVLGVKSADELLPAAYALAREIAENSAPVSVALTRQMLWRMAGESHPMAAHRIDSRGVYRRSRSSDAKEGVASFLEKRLPNYEDKVSRDMPDFYPWWQEEEYR
ncbi:crotonase/enoyl-CoA hydratase family protein [Novosphingopyxis baekryungensis]|uniref:crotonase/enoyl-CoA hydratase family protein n=1 Tax=Novosphingopyxis baekryungensis TaxID=279369 RepID=UPI0003B3CC7D|nr:crotonase/enoyl-CoA hydratase family protein [Novosphingopyxis baekryungensis]